MTDAQANQDQGILYQGYFISVLEVLDPVFTRSHFLKIGKLQLKLLVDIFHPAFNNPAKCNNISKFATAASKSFLDFVCLPMVPNYLVNMAIASPHHGESASIQHDGVRSTDFANTRQQVKIPNVLYK